MSHTENVPVEVPSDIDAICQRFGGSLPDLVKAGFAMVVEAAHKGSEHIAVLSNSPSWGGTYTILSELRISEMVKAQQGGGDNNGPPTI